MVYDCTSKLSRQIMDGTIETDYDFGGACDGRGRGSGKGSSGDTPARALAKHDFNLMRSLQLVRRTAGPVVTLTFGLIGVIQL